MVELKTKVTKASVAAFLKAIDDDQLRKDCRAIVAILRAATRAQPRMWGPSIIGFGSYHYKYASGREGDWMLTGVSPRKQSITLYIMVGFARYGDLLAKLGPHGRGKSCLYIKRLSDVHLPTLEKLVKDSVQRLMKPQSPANRR